MYANYILHEADCTICKKNVKLGQEHLALHYQFRGKKEHYYRVCNSCVYTDIDFKIGNIIDRELLVTQLKRAVENYKEHIIDLILTSL